MAASARPHDPGIDIRRLTLALRLCGDSQRLEPVARRLDGLAQGRLAHALARTRLEGPEPADSNEAGELIFIDRLAVHCGGNTAWDDDALAKHMARRLALALQARLADPDVLRFHDRPDYVAAASLAIAQGRLAQCWWFDEFDGLRPLAASTALRTLVVNEAGDGTAALARLAEPSLGQVIGTLTEGDAARLLAWVSAFSAMAPPPFPRLWQRALHIHRHADSPAIRLTALVAGERAAAGSMGLRSALMLRGMVNLLRGAADGDLPMPPGACDRSVLEAMLAPLGDDAAWLTGLTDGELDTVAAALRDLQPSPARAPALRRLATQHGGLFLLLARMDRLGWLACFQSALRQRCTEWPQARCDALCRRIACRIAALALDPRPYGSPLTDPAVIAVCRLEGPEVDDHAGLALAALRAVLRGVAPAAREPHPRPAHTQERNHRLPRLLGEAAAVVMAELARVLPGLAGSTPAFLRTQALSLPAWVEPATGDAGDESPSLVRLGRAPLDVLLVLSGVKRQRLALPGISPIQLQEDYGA